MSPDVDVGDEARSLLVRLRATCEGRWTNDRGRADQAVADHLTALGVRSRPVRWADADAGAGFDVVDAFIRAWDGGQFVRYGAVERPTDAMRARADAEKAAKRELKSHHRDVRKLAERAAAAGRRETEFCGMWCSDEAVELAVQAFARGKGLRLGAEGLTLALGRMMEEHRVTAARQVGHGLATNHAALVVEWAACADALRRGEAGSRAVEHLLAIYRPLVDAVEAGLWLFWVLEDEVVAAAAPSSRRREPVRVEFSPSGQVRVAEPETTIEPPADGGPHSAAIDRHYRELPRLMRWAQKRPVTYLPAYLSDEDELLGLAGAVLDGKKQGLLAATRSRVLFVPIEKPETRSACVEIPYDAVTSIDESHPGRVRIVSANGELEFVAANVERRRELLAVLHERARRHSAETPSRQLSATPVADIVDSFRLPEPSNPKSALWRGVARRKETMSILLERKSRKSAEVLLSALQELDELSLGSTQAYDPNFWVILGRALEALGDAAVTPLVSALESESVRVRAAVAEVLGEIRDGRAAEPLQRALRDPDHLVRSAAAAALIRMAATAKDWQQIRKILKRGDAPTTRALLESIERGSSLFEAVTALGTIGDVGAVSPLIDLATAMREPSQKYDWRFHAREEVARRAVGALTEVLYRTRSDVSTDVLRTIASLCVEVVEASYFDKGDDDLDTGHHEVMWEDRHGTRREHFGWIVQQGIRRTSRELDCRRLNECARQELARRGEPLEV